MNPHLLNRRQAIARIAVLFGGVVIGSEAFLRGATVERGPDTQGGFSAADRQLLDEIGETILPATATPGAKAADIGAFMIMMVTDCYDAKHQAIFRAGLPLLEATCRAKFGRSFLACSPAQRTELLNGLAAEQRAQPKPEPGTPPHYFLLLKQLTLLGYFTSEIGCTQALRYIEIPGAFHGDVPYKKGDRAWFAPPRPAAMS